MTLRERIADWLTDGRYLALQLEAAEQDASLDREDLTSAERAVLAIWGERCPDYEPNCPGCEAWAQLSKPTRYGAALRTIAAMETPHANATVKRMAKTAREALGE